MSDLALHDENQGWNVKDKDGRCRELMLLEEMSKVTGLDILTDHSQLASVICYHEERRGRDRPALGPGPGPPHSCVCVCVHVCACVCVQV